MVERYREQLIADSRRIVGDEAAQDAVQQALISAWSALRRGAEVRELRSWLMKIGRNAALATLREQRLDAEALPESLTGGVTPTEHLEQSVRTREALAAIAELPQPQREALVRTSVQGHSGRDTARALGVSEDALRQLTFQARATVRASARTFGFAVCSPRLAAWLGRHVRARAALAGAPGSDAALPQAGAMLGRAATVLAAGALLAAPVAVLRAGGAHDSKRSAPARTAQASGAAVSAAEVPIAASALAARKPARRWPAASRGGGRSAGALASAGPSGAPVSILNLTGAAAPTSAQKAARGEATAGSTSGSSHSASSTQADAPAAPRGQGALGASAGAPSAVGQVLTQAASGVVQRVVPAIVTATQHAPDAQAAGQAVGGEVEGVAQVAEGALHAAGEALAVPKITLESSP